MPADGTPHFLEDRVVHLEDRAAASEARLRVIEQTQSKQGVLLLRVQMEQQEARKEQQEARRAIEEKLDKLLARLQPEVTL